MAHLLKDDFSLAFVQELEKKLNLKDSAFSKTFKNQYAELELKARIKLIAELFEEHLSGTYQDKITSLSKIVEDYGGLKSLVFTQFIEDYGLNDYDTSIKAIEHFTQFGTAEFAIRPFIEKWPEKTMKQMLDWSKHENFHVRRLSSEGCRLKLPWAKPLRDFIEAPTPVLPILENLKNDKEDYVYRSVANNLNDISKDHPELALKLAKKWRGQSKSADWVVKHSMRTLLKQGHPKAFELFNYQDIKTIEVLSFESNEQAIRIGEEIELKLSLKSSVQSKSKTRIDLKVYYVKKSGQFGPKVFLFRENSLDKGEQSFIKKLKFEQLSTRKVYSGIHKMEIIINGIPSAMTNVQILN